MSEPCLEFWAFIENSDFQCYHGQMLYRQDEVCLTRHDQFLEADYQLLVDIGCIGVRDAARWYVTHPAPGLFDWTWLDRVAAAARGSGLKLYLDLWHYGYPDWVDLMSPEMPGHFAEFARQIALRYPDIQYYCVCNEPSPLVEWSGQTGLWRPFMTLKDAEPVRLQICRAIIEASKAILQVRPNAILVLPEPWHAPTVNSLDKQASIFDTVMGRRDPELGGCPELVTVIGLNHYRDATLPPFHKLLLEARKRWPEMPIWITESSGPPEGWQQAEWFWWMLAETRLANQAGANIPVFTWAPILSMYDWADPALFLANGVWIIGEDGKRVPNGVIIEAIQLARQYGYIR